MGFVAPIFTAFAVLAAVPILVHLYGRPRAVRRRFAALRFLLESDKKTASQRKLREILLLVLRAAAIAAVPLILAKPFFETRSSGAGGIGQSESAVIILDDSRSMGLRATSLIGGKLRGETMYTRAQARARSLVASLGRDSEAALLLTSQGAAAPQGELTADRQRLAQAVADAKLGHRTGDTTGALKRAAAILAASPRDTRRVYLISDLGAHGFSLEAPWGASGPELVAIDVGEKKPPSNRAVVELRVEPAAQLGPRGIQVEAVIENHGDVPLKEQPLTLRVDGKAVATGLLDLPARGRATKRFSHVFGSAAATPAATLVPAAPPPPAPAPAGSPLAPPDARAEQPSPATAAPSTSGTAPPSAGDDPTSPDVHETVVELGPDGLSDDDRRYLRVEERRRLQILVVDGDPRTVRRDDEVFYLETALRPGDRDDSRIEVRVTTPDDLLRRPLDGEDVIFLANVKAPDAPRAAALAAFAEAGGGLFLSVGDNVDPDAWNAAFGDLLPQPLATMRTVGRTLRTRDDGETSADAPSLAGDGERIARFDRSHPVLSPFGADGASPPGPTDGDSAAAATGETGGRGAAEALREARIGRHVLLRPTPNGAAGDDERRALLRLEGGAPLLVEGHKGKGRVLLLTTSLDRDWANLAIQPGFLPLVQQAARYLARASLEAPEPPSVVGQPRDIALEDGDTSVELTMPSGATRWFGEDRALGREHLHFSDTSEPGFYRVSVAGRGGVLVPRPALGFAVNVDPAESDLRRIDPGRLSAISQPSAVGAAAAPRRRVELWHSLGALLIGLLFVESLLSIRRRG